MFARWEVEKLIFCQSQELILRFEIRDLSLTETKQSAELTIGEMVAHLQPEKSIIVQDLGISCREIRSISPDFTVVRVTVPPVSATARLVGKSNKQATNNTFGNLASERDNLDKSVSLAALAKVLENFQQLPANIKSLLPNVNNKSLQALLNESKFANFND